MGLEVEDMPRLWPSLPQKKRMNHMSEHWMHHEPCE
jgi:hypothetical protein